MHSDSWHICHQVYDRKQAFIVEKSCHGCPVAQVGGVVYKCRPCRLLRAPQYLMPADTFHALRWIKAAWEILRAGNLLTGFGFFNPYWLVSSANIFVFIHLIGGYQVYLQPFMDFVETRIKLLFPNVPYLYNEYSFHCPGIGRVPVSILRLVSRSTIVCLTTVIVSSALALDILASFSNSLPSALFSCLLQNTHLIFSVNIHLKLNVFHMLPTHAFATSVFTNAKLYHEAAHCSQQLGNKDSR